MPSDNIRTLPTEWVGTSTSTTMGITSKHHPKHASDAHLDPEVRIYSHPITMRIRGQEGRHLEFVLVSANHENPGVGVLSADGRKLTLASDVGNHFGTIDGDKMYLEVASRSHGSDRAGEVFGVHILELTATS